MAYIDEGKTLRSLLEQRALDTPDHVFCIWKDEPITVARLNTAVDRVANGLAALGIRPGDHVTTMLPNGPDHIYVMLALAKLGAVWIPVNIHLKGPSLEFTLQHSHPRAMIAHADYRALLEPLLTTTEFVIWHVAGQAGGTPDLEAIKAHPDTGNPPFAPRTQDVLSISYTSGTTGEPKGVLLTDKMIRACGIGCQWCGRLQSGDVLLVWEPLYHTGGSQLVVLALELDITLVLVERFSASRFWDIVRKYRVTAFHYLGGILQILLKQPKRPDDADHPVRSIWGGGCTSEVWREFEERFGVAIYEDYGMTETSSYATYNPFGKVGSIGKPLPWFDVQIGDDAGRTLGPNEVGEIMVREREPGLLFSGYYRNPEATASALRGEWLHTGDLARCDEEGFFYFVGRKKDSVRRRGENVSAWEVERVMNDHPDIEETALIAVKNELGDEDLKVFVKPVHGRMPDPAAIAEWCRDRMPYFQIPRYFAFVDGFEKTPTERIKKERLSRSTDDCWDREAAGSGARGRAAAAPA